MQWRQGVGAAAGRKKSGRLHQVHIWDNAEGEKGMEKSDIIGMQILMDSM